MEAKASASIIACLPLAVMTLVYLTQPRLHLAAVDRAATGRIDAGCLRDLDVDRRDGHAQDDQFRLLTQNAMLEIITDNITNTRVLAMVFAAVGAVATVITLAMPLLATDHARQAHEVGGARAREAAPARARAAGARREGRAAAVAEAVHAAHRRSVQPEQVGRPGGSARAAGAGRLSRPGALCHLPVLPHGHADGHAVHFAVLCLRRPRARPDPRRQGRASASRPPISACTCRACS